MRAEIISIGTEILMGEILDTNARFMAQRLPAMGIDLYYMHQIGDNKERLVDLIRTAKDRSDVVLLNRRSGSNRRRCDTRRESRNPSARRHNVVPELEAHLRNFFERRGGRMPEQNVKQATIIPSGESVPNPRGTAPGWWVDKDGAIIVAMPGPPAEMTGMWENDVAPRLLARIGRRRSDLTDAQDDRSGRVDARRVAGRSATSARSHGRRLPQGRRRCMSVWPQRRCTKTSPATGSLQLSSRSARCSGTRSGASTRTRSRRRSVDCSKNVA